MLYGVKLNREELFMTKKNFYILYSQKNWKNFEMEISVWREGDGGILAYKFC